MISAVRATPTAPQDWQTANREYLSSRLEELRFRLQCSLTQTPSRAEIDPELESKMRLAREAAVAATRPPALDLLASLFGLTPLEQDTLLLSVAPEIDDSFSEMFASHGDPRCRRACMALAFAPHRKRAGAMTALDALLPGRPLRRFALVASRETVEHAPWSLRSPLYGDERVSAFLRGINLPERRIAQVVRPLSVGLEAPGHAEAIGEIAAGLDRNTDQWPLVRIASDSYEEAREVAKAAIRRAGLNSSELDVLLLADRRNEWEELLPLLAREAALGQTAYWIGSGRQKLLDPAVAATVRHVIEELEAPLLTFAGIPLHSDCLSTACINALPVRFLFC